MKLSTVFFGTEKFALEILKGLTKNPIFDVKYVVTQPDKPVGRKKIVTPPLTKVFAQEKGIEILQPNTLKDFDTPEADIYIVAQYGNIIPQKILDIPKYGCINTHTSLLPLYRGASPIQTALLNGESITGVTIMRMDAGMDTGDIIFQKELKVSPDDTYTDVDDKLAVLSVDAINESIKGYISGELKPQKQDESKASSCKILSKEDGKVDWHKSAQEIYNQYRGLSRWPGIWTTFNDKRLKLIEVGMDKGIDKSDLAPGELAKIHKKLYAGTQNGLIEIKKLQLEGKPAVTAEQFLSGYSQLLGKRMV